MPIHKITAEVDARHRLQATVPDSVGPGKVEILVLVSENQCDDDADAWMAGIAREWSAELNDPREDIYTLDDGVAENGAR